MNEALGRCEIRNSWFRVDDPEAIEAWSSETSDGLYDLRVVQRPRVGDFELRAGRVTKRAAFCAAFRAFACASMRSHASEPCPTQDAEKPALAGFSVQWERLDSNQRRHTPTGLQPVPFSLSGTLPAHAAAEAAARRS